MSPGRSILRGCLNHALRTSAASMTTFTFITPLEFHHSSARVAVRLLGPCYKTGRLKPFCQHPQRACGPDQAVRQRPTTPQLYAVTPLSPTRTSRCPAEALVSIFLSLFVARAFVACYKASKPAETSPSPPPHNLSTHTETHVDPPMRPKCTAFVHSTLHLVRPTTRGQLVHAKDPQTTTIDSDASEYWF